MLKSSPSYAYAPPDSYESPTCPADLTPALQQALAMLADIDTYYDEACQKLEHWPGPDTTKQRFFGQLEARRQREPSRFCVVWLNSSSRSDARRCSKLVRFIDQALVRALPGVLLRSRGG